VAPDVRGPTALTLEQRRAKWSNLYSILDSAITAAQSKGNVFVVHKLAYQLKALDPCHDYTYDQLLYHLRSMGFQYGRIYRSIKTGRSKDYVLEHLWEYSGRRVERHTAKDPGHVDIFLDECWLWQDAGGNYTWRRKGDATWSRVRGEKGRHVGSPRAAGRSRAFKMIQNCFFRAPGFVQWRRGCLCFCSGVVCCEVNCSSAKWGVLAAIARVVGEDGEYDYEAGRFEWGVCQTPIGECAKTSGSGAVLPGFWLCRPRVRSTLYVRRRGAHEAQCLTRGVTGCVGGQCPMPTYSQCVGPSCVAPWPGRPCQPATSGRVRSCVLVVLYRLGSANCGGRALIGFFECFCCLFIHGRAMGGLR